jgi:hypothetical protein
MRFVSAVLSGGPAIAATFCLFALLLCLPARAQNLSLTLAGDPPRAGTITTARADSVSFTVASGHQISFARGSGRDYRLEAGGGFSWTQVQELPQDVETVVLTPVLLEDGSIEVAVSVSRKADSRQQSFSSTLIAQPGEWLQLFGPAPQQARRSKVYGTQALSGNSLFLLVEPR